MGGGPARAFPQRDPGARSVLSVEFAADARGQILGVRGEMVMTTAPIRRREQTCRITRHRPVRSLPGAGLSAAGERGPYQQGARGHRARRGLSAGGIRDGTRAGPDRAGRGHRPRGMPPAQPDSGGPDPLCQAAEVQGRGAAHDRQRRFSGPAGARAGRDRLCGIRCAPAQGGRARPVPWHRPGQWRQADGARAVRVREGPYRAVRTDFGLYRRAGHGAGHRDDPGAAVRGAFRRGGAGRPGAGRGHRVRQPWHGRIRQPPGHDGGIGGDAGGGPGARKAIRSAAALLGVEEDCLLLADGEIKTPDGRAVSLARLATLWKGVPGYALPGRDDPGWTRPRISIATRNPTPAPRMPARSRSIPAPGRRICCATWRCTTAAASSIPCWPAARSTAAWRTALATPCSSGWAMTRERSPSPRPSPSTCCRRRRSRPASTCCSSRRPPRSIPGRQGIGECATVPVAAAVIGAVEDALRAHGVRIAEFPLTPMRLLALIDQGRGSIPGDC